MPEFTRIPRTYDVPDGWKHPVEDIRVKPPQSQTLEYSPAELNRILDIIDQRDDELLRLLRLLALHVVPHVGQQVD